MYGRYSASVCILSSAWHQQQLGGTAQELVCNMYSIRNLVGSYCGRQPSSRACAWTWHSRRDMYCWVRERCSSKQPAWREAELLNRRTGGSLLTASGGLCGRREGGGGGSLALAITSSGALLHSSGRGRNCMYHMGGGGELSLLMEISYLGGTTYHD